MALVTSSVSRCGATPLALHRRAAVLNQTARRSVVVRASSDNKDVTLAERFAVPAAALMGACLLLAATPDEALAARSGGRVGGSSFSSRPRSAPRAAPSGRASGGGSTYNYYSAPPIISPYGMGMPFGGGFGVGFFPVMGIGSLFNILILMFILNTVLQVVRNFTNGDGAKRRGESWDDEDEKW